MLSVWKYPHLKLGGRIKEELVSQVGWAGSQHHLMSFEWLVVAGYNSDVAKLLAGPQWVHVLQGCVAVARQSKTQHLHLFWGGKQTKRRLNLKERPKSKHRNKNTCEGYNQFYTCQIKSMWSVTVFGVFFFYSCSNNKWAMWCT